MPPCAPLEAQTFRGIVEALDGIVEECPVRGGPRRYFAALYRRVTLRIEHDIANGVFDDGPRMERLDVLFANRYLDSYASFQAEERPTSCCRLAFEAAQSLRPIVLQHLLLGINGHTSLDLGIAAARVTSTK